MILMMIIGTPGPNNTVLLFSGLNQGYKNSLKLLFAINFGVVSMVIISSISIGFISSIFTVVEKYLWILSTILLVYMSYTMWPKKTSNTQITDKANISMLFFQFLNPKIWLASITVATTFQNRLSIFSIGLLTIIIGLSLNSLWIILGVRIGRMQLKIPNETLSKIGAIILFISTLLFFFGYVLQRN
jgi:threonine/homoserine/homoserine lactone efflux protein